MESSEEKQVLTHLASVSSNIECERKKDVFVCILENQ